MPRKKSKGGSGKPQSKPDQASTKDQKRSITGDVHVRGEVTFEAGPEEKLARETAQGGENTKYREKRFVEWATLAVVTIYAALTAVQSCQSIRATNIAEESLASVQRAFVTFDSLKVTRQHITDQNGIFHDNIEISSVWTNSGVTPATDVIEFTRAYPINREPSDSEFRRVVNVTGSVGRSSIGAKQTIEGEPAVGPTRDVLGPFTDSRSALPTTAHFPNGFAIWGWTVYRDIFNKTPAHLSEFCKELNSLSLPPTDHPTDPIKLTMRNCPHHNCEDEYCPDYAAILEVTAAIK